MKRKSIRSTSVIVAVIMVLSALAGACVVEQDDSPDSISETTQEVGVPRLNVPVDRRNFGGNIVEQDFYYTVGTLCSPGFERAALPSRWITANPRVIKLSGYGACDFAGWESPDRSDCRARIHAHTNAFWGGVECEASVFEEATAKCCSSHPSRGCENFGVSECVCARDPFCCNNHWDSLCVAEVTSFGCGTCPGVSASGSCFVARTTPGCNDFSLASCVCNTDAFCCDVAWDSLCVHEARTLDCP